MLVTTECRVITGKGPEKFVLKVLGMNEYLEGDVDLSCFEHIRSRMLKV